MSGVSFGFNPVWCVTCYLDVVCLSPCWLALDDNITMSVITVYCHSNYFVCFIIHCVCWIGSIYNHEAMESLISVWQLSWGGNIFRKSVIKRCNFIKTPCIPIVLCHPLQTDCNGSSYVIALSDAFFGTPIAAVCCYDCLWRVMWSAGFADISGAALLFAVLPDVLLFWARGLLRPPVHHFNCHPDASVSGVGTCHWILCN